ncbi:MAG TPA: Xaa-Pro aminopeptidase [Thermoanaerobaculia bacterium]
MSWRRYVCAVGITLAAAALSAETAPWYQTDFPPEEFRARWEKIFAKIGDKSVALVAGAPSVGGFLLPRQYNEFYYLCGVETPGAYILLDGRSRKATLYLPPRNARLEAAEGKVLSGDDKDVVQKLVGVDDVQSIEGMRGDWLASSSGALPESIWIPFAPEERSAEQRYELLASNAAIAADSWDGRTPREARLAELLRARYPRAKVQDLTPVLDELRGVKSPREIALLRRAAQIAGLGLLEAMRSTRPGVYEYELDAAARYVFLVNGARLEAYRSITASGTDNIWNMHYFRNNKALAAGEIVLMDYAPDYRYYTSDITRIWPVSGKYSPAQRELLGFVLAYRNEIMKRIRPGAAPKEIQEEAKAAMEPLFAKTQFSKPVYAQAARKLVDTGGGVFSHPVGMAVHDDGGYADRPLQPGVVFSVDPQLRVPEENLYIRYEDVVVVTEKGFENFTDFLPSGLEDLERAVRGDGIVQRFPPSAAGVAESHGKKMRETR